MTFGPGLLATHGTVAQASCQIAIAFLIDNSEGDHHRKQRKMLNPVFSINHMRHMTPIFYRVARRVRFSLSYM